MKNYSIFAAYFAKVCFITIAVVVFFCIHNSALNAVNIGYQIPVVYYTAKVSKCTLASSGGDSLSYLLNFSFTMPKYNEDVSKVNNSSRTNTSTGTKSVEISQLFHPEFIEFTKQLGVMREWLDKFRDEVARHDEQIHSHLIDAESSLFEVANNFSALLAIEFREKVYFNNL